MASTKMTKTTKLDQRTVLVSRDYLSSRSCSRSRAFRLIVRQAQASCKVQCVSSCVVSQDKPNHFHFKNRAIGGKEIVRDGLLTFGALGITRRRRFVGALALRKEKDVRGNRRSKTSLTSSSKKNKNNKTNQGKTKDKTKSAKRKTRDRRGVKKSLKKARKQNNRSLVDDVTRQSRRLRTRLVDLSQDVVDRVNLPGARGASSSKGFNLSATRQQQSLSPFNGPLGGPRGIKLGSHTIEVLVVCTLGLLFAASAVLRGNRGSKRGRRGPGGQRGTWVKDRSLGGKMIFVPATPDYDYDYSSYRTSATTTTTSSSTSSFAVKSSEKVKAKPTWWTYDEFPSSSGRSNEGMRPQVQQLMTVLEDAKAVYGRDVNVYDLVELKQLCARFNLEVKPKTENSRDSMFRTAIQGALDTVEQGGALVGTEPIEDLLNGLCICLGVPQERAAVISNGEVAARLRAQLLQTVVFMRTNKDLEFSLSLIKLDNILSKLPFNEGRESPEIEVITRSLKNRMTDEERKKIFQSFPSQQEGDTVNSNLITMKEILGL